MLFNCLIVFTEDSLLISAMWEEAYEALRRGRAACYRVPFLCMDLFIHLAYAELVS